MLRAAQVVSEIPTYGDLDAETPTDKAEDNHCFEALRAIAPLVAEELEREDALLAGKVQLAKTTRRRQKLIETHYSVGRFQLIVAALAKNLSPELNRDRPQELFDALLLRDYRQQVRLLEPPSTIRRHTDSRISVQQKRHTASKIALRLRRDCWKLRKDFLGLAYEKWKNYAATEILKGGEKTERILNSFAVYDQGVVREFSTEPSGSAGVTPTLKRAPKRYRSELKRNVLTTLIQNPSASDRQVCQSVDEQGYRHKSGESLENIYKNQEASKNSIEATIGKVRSDMQKAGILPLR